MRSLGRGRLDGLLDPCLEMEMEKRAVTYRRLVAVQHTEPIDPCPCRRVGLVARRGSQSQ